MATVGDSSALKAHPVQLSASWSRLARWIWLAYFIVAATLLPFRAIVTYQNYATVCVAAPCAEYQLDTQGAATLANWGMTPRNYAAVGVAQMGLLALLVFLMAGLLMWKRPFELMPVFMAFVFVAVGVTFFGNDAWLTYPVWRWPEQGFWFIQSAALVPLFCLFPEGRFRNRWLKWIALASIPPHLISFLPSPLSSDSWLFTLYGVFIMACFLTVIAALIYHYRRVANHIQRLQVKWVLYGTVVAMVTLLFTGIFENWVLPTAGRGSPYSLLLEALRFVAVMFSFAGFAIALLRYRLYAVDLLINRTLVYVGLTAVTIGIYVLLVGGAGSLLQAQGSAAIAFVATGVVAVLFQPLRLRLQTAVDRLMYGQRDDPVGMLTHLAQRLETANSPESILPTLVETIATALKLPHVSLWLPASDAQWEAAAVFGSQATELHTLPLLYQNEEIARLLVAPRGPGEGFSSEEERLLTTIAQLSATTVQASRLSSELQRSRQQIVTSREEERRRLRRDLHDGLGPLLASVALQADTARDLVEADPGETRHILNSIMELSQTAVTDVRRLVYGLRPPALDEMGLGGTLQQLAQRYQHQLRITVDTPEVLPTLPAGIEVAAYRIVYEAVHNAVKHAQALTCTVTIRVDGGLVLSIVDDGTGLKVGDRAGVGLISMKERAAELGGRCLIQSEPGGGTRVSAVLPLPLEGLA